MTEHFFAYGTLQVRTILARVIGRELDGQAARLAGYARYRVADRPYPGIVAVPSGAVDGVLYAGLEAADLARLDAYEGEAYERRELAVTVGEHTLAAHTYVMAAAHLPSLTGEAWDLERFEREHLERYLADAD